MTKNSNQGGGGSCRKLSGCGLSPHSLKCMRSFLANRRRRVKVGNMHSEWATLSCGIPQGTVLGPTLFLVFIKGGSVTIFSDILRFWGRAKMARLIAQVSRTSDDHSSVRRANNFKAQPESIKCHFPRAIAVFRGLALWPPLFFPLTKWLQKITDYCDTAGLMTCQRILWASRLFLQMTLPSYPVETTSWRHGEL